MSNGKKRAEIRLVGIARLICCARGCTMQNYHIFVDEVDDKSRPNFAPTYRVALIPSSHNSGAMKATGYLTKEAFIGDLQRYLGYTGAAIERFFSTPDRRDTLTHRLLSDED